MVYLKAAKERNLTTAKALSERVTSIIDDVRARGDRALLEYSETFDGCRRPHLKVTPEEIQAAYAAVAPADIDDIRQAAEHILQFATAQRETLGELPSYQLFPGAILGHRIIPIEACCCYVPGGNYPLYSTALMLAIPAKVAGVKRVTACSPAMKGSNQINARTLVALDLAGVDEIYVVGGAQAIAAFAYGTEQIQPVDLIVGPGNSYVAEAKRQCYGQVGIDFVAGPSEVLVVADDTAPAAIIAADLLAQCEHDRIAQSILVTTSEALGTEVIAQVEHQLTTLDTAEIAELSWEDYGEVIVVDNVSEAVELANHRAPEHLELMIAQPDQIAEQLINYGSLFIGQYTAEVFGDYASGTNHTLPTLRAARYTGGVWVGTFLKTCTHQTFSKEAMLRLTPLVSRLARGESLIGHAHAAEFRENQWK